VAFSLVCFPQSINYLDQNNVYVCEVQYSSIKHICTHIHAQERATQSHAIALADARVGGQWWRHLRTLNRPDLQEALLLQDEDRWQVLKLYSSLIVLSKCGNFLQQGLCISP